MGSGTQVDQDDFKAAVEQFAERIKAVDEELESQVKSSQAKAAELFESARLQSAMVFGLDDEPIPGVDAPSNASSATAARTSSTSIALNPLARSTAHKRKHEQSSANADQASNDAMLLAHSFKESTAVLAQALLSKNQTKLLPTHASEASLPTNINSLDDRILRMETCLTEMQHGMDSRLMEVESTMSSRLAEVQQNMEARLGDVTGLLGRILAAVGTKQGGDDAPSRGQS